jgi:hypothetical protein
MKILRSTTDLHRNYCSWLTLLFCLAGMMTHGGATNTAPAKVEPPLSSFVDDPKVGRDPFFPRSSRRAPSTPAPAVVQATPQAPAIPSFGQFKLQGISHSANKKIALINSRTFEAGEEGEVKTTDGRARLRVVEVKESSVIILVGGTQRHELYLGDSTLGPSASAK